VYVLPNLILPPRGALINTSLCHLADLGFKAYNDNI
jgi:hypothetical protein